MPALENAQHEKFVQELVKGAGQGEAYLAAGYNAKSVSVASAAATRLLKDVKIQSRINELQSKAEAETMLTLDEHMRKLRELRDAAFNDGKYNAAITAEVKRGELRKFYVKQVENGVPGSFDNLSDQEVFDLYDQAAQEIAQGAGDTVKGKRSRATQH